MGLRVFTGMWIATREYPTLELTRPFCRMALLVRGTSSAMPDCRLGPQVPAVRRVSNKARPAVFMACAVLSRLS